MNPEENKRFLGGGVGVALLCEQFLPIREWRCEDINALITGIIRIDETLLALCCI